MPALRKRNASRVGRRSPERNYYAAAIMRITLKSWVEREKNPNRGGYGLIRGVLHPPGTEDTRRACEVCCGSSTNVRSTMKSVSSSPFLLLTSQGKAWQVLFLNGPVRRHRILFLSVWACFLTFAIGSSYLFVPGPQPPRATGLGAARFVNHPQRERTPFRDPYRTQDMRRETVVFELVVLISSFLCQSPAAR